MEMERDLLKPCMIQTPQGFTVKYKNRLLYSKYNPSKSINTIIQNLTILPGSVILCISPALNYGIPELFKKLPENSIILGVEIDEELYKLSKSDPLSQLEDYKNFKLLCKDELEKLPALLSEENGGKYRRCLRIDFSSASAFNSEYYDSLTKACQEAIGQFWKNRITLVKFGRRYAKNIFTNLRLLPESHCPIKVSKPILVVGAGESAEESLKTLSGHREKFFILSVDAVLQTLKSLNIRTDAVICEEAQDIIAGAFTGSKNQCEYFFVSTSSNPNVTKLCPEKNIFYSTRYAKTLFLEKLKTKEIIPDFIPPLGSVGLSAIEIALKIRKSEEIPVFVTGLDFSYSRGKSHVKDSFHDKNRRSCNNRITGLDAFSSCFNPDSKAFIDKNKNTFYTTSALTSYAELFRYKFSKTENLFDVGKSGIPLGIKKVDFKDFLNDSESNFPYENTITKERKINKKERIIEYLKEEKEALLKLKAIFTGKTKLSEKEMLLKIKELLSEREYLYLHFPDGYKLDLTQDFLNRIRIEIDYFLKIIK